MDQKEKNTIEVRKENELIAENLKKEFERIVGEPDFAAVKTFKFDYSDYQIRKYK